MATENPYWFSTKPTDDATGFTLYENRVYETGLGKWKNRDPLYESGFRILHMWPRQMTPTSNLYRFLGNEPLGRVDRLGLLEIKGNCGAWDPNKIKEKMEEGYKAHIDTIREPLRQAIKDLWPKFVFTCDQTKPRCKPNSKQLPGGVIEIYKVLAFTPRGMLGGFANRRQDGTPESNTVQKLAKHSGTICPCNIDNYDQFLSLGIHEVAHGAGWGGKYVDPVDPSLDNGFTQFNPTAMVEDHPEIWKVPDLMGD